MKKIKKDFIIILKLMISFIKLIKKQLKLKLMNQVKRIYLIKRLFL